MDIITVKDLNLWYNTTQALKNVNINIEENTITALIGPSGCGKSTFLKTINRMNDLVQGVRTTGEILYCDTNIFDKSVDVNELRRDIGMVFQKPNPFSMSIYDNIAYGPRTHGIKNKIILQEGLVKYMRNRFDEQLLLLNNKMIEMGAMCEALISFTSATLLSGNTKDAGEVKTKGQEIDRMEREIESICLKLLLQKSYHFLVA